MLKSNPLTNFNLLTEFTAFATGDWGQSPGLQAQENFNLLTEFTAFATLKRSVLI